jgi:hypothetical protein
MNAIPESNNERVATTVGVNNKGWRNLEAAVKFNICQDIFTCWIVSIEGDVSCFSDRAPPSVRSDEVMCCGLKYCSIRACSLNGDTRLILTQCAVRGGLGGLIRLTRERAPQEAARFGAAEYVGRTENYEWAFGLWKN